MMLKREMQEMIELMFYPDDYEELQSLLIVNYESGMYMFEENDAIDNVNWINMIEVCYDVQISIKNFRWKLWTN